MGTAEPQPQWSHSGERSVSQPVSLPSSLVSGLPPADLCLLLQTTMPLSQQRPARRPQGMVAAKARHPRHLEQPLPTTGVSLADLEDSADSSSILLVPPDPAQSGTTPATEALPGGGGHSHSSLNTVV